jgi:hypothetical protein
MIDAFLPNSSNVYCFGLLSIPITKTILMLGLIGFGYWILDLIQLKFCGEMSLFPKRIVISMSAVLRKMQMNVRILKEMH